MNIALHPTDQPALVDARGHTTRRDPDRRPEDRRPRPRPRGLRAGVALTTAIVALTVGAASPALAEVVTEFTDTYTMGHKLVPGLADGWFEPGSQPDQAEQPDQPDHPIGRVR